MKLWVESYGMMFISIDITMEYIYFIMIISNFYKKWNKLLIYNKFTIFYSTNKKEKTKKH